MSSLIPPPPPWWEFYGIFADMSRAVRVALPGTLRAVLFNPLLLLRPFKLRRLFMSFVWDVYGDGLDSGTRELKSELITPHATGIVLDIGAGELIKQHLFSRFLWPLVYLFNHLLRLLVLDIVTYRLFLQDMDTRFPIYLPR